MGWWGSGWGRFLVEAGLVSQQWEGDFETSEAAKNRLWVVFFFCFLVKFRPFFWWEKNEPAMFSNPAKMPYQKVQLNQMSVPHQHPVFWEHIPGGNLRYRYQELPRIATSERRYLLQTSIFSISNLGGSSLFGRNKPVFNGFLRFLLKVGSVAYIHPIGRIYHLCTRYILPSRGWIESLPPISRTRIILWSFVDKSNLSTFWLQPTRNDPRNCP